MAVLFQKYTRALPNGMGALFESTVGQDEVINVNKTRPCTSLHLLSYPAQTTAITESLLGILSPVCKRIGRGLMRSRQKGGAEPSLLPAKIVSH